MANIKSVKEGKEVMVPDGDPIRESCKELEVPFNCEDGVCGTCAIEVVEGQENLSDLTEKEEFLDKDRKNRLACQCKINSGNISIDF